MIDIKFKHYTYYESSSSIQIHDNKGSLYPYKIDYWCQKYSCLIKPTYEVIYVVDCYEDAKHLSIVLIRNSFL